MDLRRRKSVGIRTDTIASISGTTITMTNNLDVCTPRVGRGQLHARRGRLRGRHHNVNRQFHRLCGGFINVKLAGVYFNAGGFSSACVSGYDTADVTRCAPWLVRNCIYYTAATGEAI